MGLELRLEQKFEIAFFKEKKYKPLQDILFVYPKVGQKGGKKRWKMFQKKASLFFAMHTAKPVNFYREPANNKEWNVLDNIRGIEHGRFNYMPSPPLSPNQPFIAWKIYEGRLEYLVDTVGLPATYASLSTRDNVSSKERDRRTKCQNDIEAAMVVLRNAAYALFANAKNLRQLGDRESILLQTYLLAYFKQIIFYPEDTVSITIEGHAGVIPMPKGISIAIMLALWNFSLLDEACVLRKNDSGEFKNVEDNEPVKQDDVFKIQRKADDLFTNPAPERFKKAAKRLERYITTAESRAFENGMQEVVNSVISSVNSLLQNMATRLPAA